MNDVHAFLTPDVPTLNRFLRHFLRLVVAQAALLLFLVVSAAALWQIGTPDQTHIAHLSQELATARTTITTLQGTITTLQGTITGYHSETVARLKSLQAGEQQIEAEITALERQKGPHTP